MKETGFFVLRIVTAGIVNVFHK